MKSLKITGIIAAILIAGLVTLSLTLDGVVKRQLETEMSSLMETEVQVGDANLSIFSGRGQIEDLTIRNPKGFSDNDAIFLDVLKIRMDLSSLLDQTVMVHEVRIEAPDLFVEQEGVGVNLRTLMSNMNKGSEETDDQKNLLIEKLIVTNGSLEVETNIDKKRTTTASVDRIELSGIGRNGSSTVRQSIQQVMTPIIEEALTEALKDGAVDQLKDAARDLIGG